MSKGIPHGTTSGYGRHRCRCGKCRRAAADAMRTYSAKRRAQGRPLGVGRKRNRTFSGVCEQCGQGFTAEQSQRFCSQACFGLSCRRVYSTELVHVGPKPEPVAPPVPVTVVSLPKWWGVIVNGPCVWCGFDFTALSKAALYCSDRCIRQAAKARHGRFAVKPRFRYAIYQRDDWTCQLCLEPVERDAVGSWRPTLDHVIPRSKGGADAWENLRLAHAWCNSVRGDGTYHADLFEEAS